MTVVKILLGLALLCFVVGLLGCAPGVGTTSYATALNGMYSPAYPMYQYPAPQYQSLYVVPRVSCVQQGNLETCRPI